MPNVNSIINKYIGSARTERSELPQKNMQPDPELIKAITGKIHERRLRGEISSDQERGQIFNAKTQGQR